MSQKMNNTKKKFPAGKKAESGKVKSASAGAKRNTAKAKQTGIKFGAEKARPTAKKQPAVPGEWLYMCTKEHTVQDIKQAFGTDSSYDIEVWEEAGVLEIGFGEKSSFDMEAAEIHPKDEITIAFAGEHGVKNVFLVTFKPEDYEEAQKIMKTICDACDGFFCGDTENFTPVFPE